MAVYNQAVTITKRDFQDFAQRKLAEAITNPTVYAQRLKEVFDFAIAKESSMDEEAVAYFDQLLDGFATIFEQGLAGIPDSQDKRKWLRMVALAKRKHHRAENFLKGLGRRLPTPFPVAETAKPIFLDIVQSVLDLLFDATREDQHGAAPFASLSLLYWTVDELNTAFYLAERKYTTQAFSHIRTVHDLADKAELFFEKPNLVELWGSGDHKKIIRELSPAAVRIKLGRPQFDPIYDFFTDRGMHGTFSAVRQRTIQRDKRQGGRSVSIWLGGAAWAEEVDIAVSSCILAGLLSLTMVVKVFRDRLHEEEVRAILNGRADAAREFLKEHLIKPLQNSGANVSDLSQRVDALTRVPSTLGMP